MVPGIALIQSPGDAVVWVVDLADFDADGDLDVFALSITGQFYLIENLTI